MNNTGHYVMSRRQLILTQGKSDTRHYCPPIIKMADLVKHEPDLAGILALLSHQRQIVGVTVAVKAWPKAGPRKKK
jgi:hypothetical protein